MVLLLVMVAVHSELGIALPNRARLYRQWIVWISEVLQTGFYIDFFHYYFLA